MPSRDADDVKPTGAAMRRLYALSCWLVAIIGLPLFFWPTETERNFAWTIHPPVTAAFLGAAYFASFFVVYIGRRESCWANARIGWTFAAAFAWLMLVATALHFDRFHFGTAFVPAARFMAWTWLAVYIVVPLLQAALGVRQFRLRGGDPPATAPMPPAARGIAASMGIVLLATGLALFAFPGRVAAAVWPWALTPLTGRAVAAWLVAWGIVAAQAAWEGDWRRARAGLVGLMVFGALELVVQLRFADGIGNIAFAVGAAALLLLGAYGTLQALSVGPAPVYRYVDRWRVAGRIEDVAEILRDGESYPRWWRAVYLEVRTIRKGDARRIGEVGQVRARGFLPYVVEFAARVTDERFPHGFSLVAEGELQGVGEWRIDAHGPWVDVEYHWAVSGNKPLWRYTSFLLRPVFEANHHWTMRRGEEALRLELARRLAPAEEARAAVPLPPGPVAGLRATVRAFAEVLLHVGRGTSVRLSHSTLIRRPPAEVFAFIARVENDLLWQREISEVTVTSAGPMGVGSTFRERRRTLGRGFIWEMRVTAWEAGRHIAIESASGSPPYRGSREVAPAPGGTRITESSEIELPWVLQPLSRWIARASLASVVAAYDTLRLQIEAGDVSSRPQRN